MWKFIIDFFCNVSPLKQIPIKYCRKVAWLNLNSTWHVEMIMGWRGSALVTTKPETENQLWSVVCRFGFIWVHKQPTSHSWLSLNASISMLASHRACAKSMALYFYDINDNGSLIHYINFSLHPDIIVLIQFSYLLF